MNEKIYPEPESQPAFGIHVKDLTPYQTFQLNQYHKAYIIALESFKPELFYSFSQSHRNELLATVGIDPSCDNPLQEAIRVVEIKFNCICKSIIEDPSIPSYTE